jgi:hypothetical protein
MVAFASVVVHALCICCFVLPHAAITFSLTPQQFNAGALLLTQQALNDGVNRYNEWFWDMIAYLEEQPTFPSESQWGGCGNPQYQYFPDPDPCPSFAGQKCSKIHVDQSKVRFQIASSNQIVVNAAGVEVVTGARVWLRESQHVLFWCLHSDICSNNVVTITTTFDLTLVLRVALVSDAIVITSEPPTLDNLQDDLEGCSPDWWARHTGNWHQQLNSAIRTFIQQAAQKETAKMAVPQEFFPNPDVKVTYWVGGMLWCAAPLAPPCTTTFPDAYIVFTSIGTIEYIATDGSVNSTYLPDPSYAAITIPLDFPSSAPDTTLHMLTAVRLSAILVSGLMWVADQSGSTTYRNNGTILDASFNVTVSYSPPSTGIRSLNILNMTIAGGLVSCTCWLTANSSAAEAKPVLIVSFENVLAIGTVLYTNDSNPGLIIRIDHIDTSQMTSAPILPPLPLPLDFQADVVKLAVAGLQPVINLYLLHSPFMLPPQLLPFTAHPILSLNPIENAVPHGAGFIQILSVCSSQGQTEYDTCQYQAHSEGNQRATALASRDRAVQVPPSLPCTAFTRELRDKNDDSDGLLLNVFWGSSNCDYTMQSSSSMYSLNPTNGDCLPMQTDVDPTFNFTSFYNLTGHSESLNLSALCDSSCQRCQVFSDGGLSDSCVSVTAKDSSVKSFAIGVLCKGSGSVSSGYVVAAFNPSFPGAATCDVVAPGCSDRVASYNTLGPADGRCRLGQSGLFSSVTASSSGNVDFRFNCDYFNCSSCEIELLDIAPDQCTILASNVSQQFISVKVWDITDVATCDVVKPSISSTIVVVLASVFGFIIAIAIVRVVYIRRYELKSSIQSFLSWLLSFGAYFRQMILQRRLSTRFTSIVLLDVCRWLQQQLMHAVVLLRTCIGWRFSDTREQPLFVDVVQFVMVCVCGGICKWWSGVWEVQHAPFLRLLHRLPHVRCRVVMTFFTYWLMEFPVKCSVCSCVCRSSFTI